jgi:hypothetical protein
MSRLRAIGRLWGGGRRASGGAAARAASGSANMRGVGIVGVGRVGSCVVSPEHQAAFVGAHVGECHVVVQMDDTARVGVCWVGHHATIGA